MEPIVLALMLAACLFNVGLPLPGICVRLTEICFFALAAAWLCRIDDLRFTIDDSNSHTAGGNDLSNNIQFDAMKSQSSIVNRQSSISDRESSIVHRPSSIGYHQSAIRNPQSAILLWLVAGGYLIFLIVASYGRGLGSVRFEIEAMLAGAIALCWARRVSDRAIIMAASIAILIAGMAALALAAIGIRGIWFYGAGAPWTVIPMAQGASAASRGYLGFLGSLEIGGVFGHKNFLAAFLVLALPVSIAGIFQRECNTIGRPLRLLSLCAFVVGVIVLLLTGALFGIAAAALSLAIAAVSWLGDKARTARTATTTTTSPSFDQPSDLANPQSAIHNPQSAIRNPQSTIVNRQSSIPISQSSIVNRQSSILNIPLIIAAVALSLLISVLIFSGRAEALMEGKWSGSLEARAYLWDKGREIVAEHPWLGIGRVGLLDEIAGGFPHAHNLFLMKFIETGVFGGALFAALILIVLTAALHALFGAGWGTAGYSAPRAALGAGLIAFALYSLTDYFYNEPPLMMLFWLAAGIALGARPQPIPPKASSK
ncbi:MAG: O-antigen ligase family protein [Candidatus Sumerlaeota bacterium]|nr:O-antigen ligase family protein [Candidatus Sumerlaeota bacterium]